MPDGIEYDQDTRRLIIGAEGSPGIPGVVENVSPEMWAYTMGDKVPVIRRWFDYRRKKPRRKRTSPLDDINPRRWTAQFDDEFLDLLNVIGRCTALEPQQDRLLTQICSGPLINVEDLDRYGLLFTGKTRRPRRSTAAGQATLDD
jgi:hypothetical protein